MITERTKAVAKARIRQQISCEDISAELEIPLKLVEEWAKDLSPKDMLVQEAITMAVDKIHGQAGGELLPMYEDILKVALEETAIDITKAMPLAALQGDMVHAKTLQLLANAVVQMYQTIILKGNKGGGEGNSDSGAIDTFAEYMRD